MKLAVPIVFVLTGAMQMTPAFAANIGPRTHAQSPQVEPAYNWTGFYLGVNAGSGSGQTNTDELCFDCNVPGHTFPLGQHSYSGFIGGGQIGYNYQLGNFAVGVEGDFDGTNIHGALVGLQNDYVNTTRYNWIASIRGRAGFAIDKVFIYATGGGAFTSVEHSSLDNAIGAPEASTTKSGSVVGGGLEFAIDNHWSIRGEYLSYDFGRNRLQINLVPIRPIYFEYTDQIQSVRAGIDYKF